MSVDEYGNTECRICTHTCDFADENSGLCCNCSSNEEEKCEQCEERSTPR